MTVQLVQSLSVEEMEALGRKAARIRDLRKELSKARGVLDLVNKHVKSAQVWRPTLCLERAKHPGYGDRDTSIEIEIPGGVIQQQAVYAVERLERELRSLGAQP